MDSPTQSENLPELHRRYEEAGRNADEQLRRWGLEPDEEPLIWRAVREKFLIVPNWKGGNRVQAPEA